MDQNVNWLIHEFLSMFNRVVQEHLERIGEILERERMEDRWSDDSDYYSDDDDDVPWPLPLFRQNRPPIELEQLIIDLQAIHDELETIAGDMPRLENFRLSVEGVQRFGADYLPAEVGDEEDDNN